MKCEGCGHRTEGSTGYCRTCKSGRFNGHKRVREEKLLLEQVIPNKPGSVWCAWDKIGNVMAGPSDTRHEVLMQLSGRWEL